MHAVCVHTPRRREGGHPEPPRSSGTSTDCSRGGSLRMRRGLPQVPSGGGIAVSIVLSGVRAAERSQRKSGVILLSVRSRGPGEERPLHRIQAGRHANHARRHFEPPIERSRRVGELPLRASRGLVPLQAPLAGRGRSRRGDLCSDDQAGTRRFTSPPANASASSTSWRSRRRTSPPFVGLLQIRPGLVADVEVDPAGSHAENERHTDMDVTARGAVD